jgi:CRP-like cAMP-binding protein
LIRNWRKSFIAHLILQENFFFEGKLDHLKHVKELSDQKVKSSREKAQVRPRSKRLEAAISRIPIFQNLSDIDRQKLASLASLHIYRKEDIILREGDPERSLYIVLDGQVLSFTYDYQGNMIVLDTLGHDQFFGVIGMLIGGPQTASIMAAEESLLAEFPFEEMQEFFEQYPLIKSVFQEHSQKDLEDTATKREKAGARDRRIHPRFNMALSVKFLVLPEENIEEALTEEVHRAKSKDISLSGIRLEIQDPNLQNIPLEASLKLEIEFPENHGKIQALGTIKNRFHNEEISATFLGIHFFKLSSTGMICLKQFLYG